MLRLWIFLLAIGLLANESLGYCFRGMLTRNPDGEPYCSFRGHSLKPGERKKMPAPLCVSCSCSTFGLTCCSYGAANLAMIQIPPFSRCRPVADGCELKWVYRNDETRDCPENERFLMDEPPIFD